MPRKKVKAVAERSCCEDPEFDLAPAREALRAAETLPDILAVVYGLPPAQRAQLVAEIGAAKNCVLGIEA